MLGESLLADTITNIFGATVGGVVGGPIGIGIGFGVGLTVSIIILLSHKTYQK